MEHAHELFENLALVLCVAAVTTVVFQWLRQPVVLGYLLAGLIVGPHTPIPLTADENTLQTLSELGVVLLMFSLGLEFSLKRLIRVAQTGGVVAIVEVSLMIWLGFMIGKSFGWSSQESIFTGAIIAISSTTIIAKTFEENKVETRLSEIVFGVLIAEDLLAVLLVTVLTALTSGEGVSASKVMLTMGRLGAFLAAFVAVGLFVIPRMVRIVARLSRPETTVITNVGICFAVAYAAYAFGYSTALGAFLGGSLVAESGKAKRVEHLIEPIRDMFAAIFFVSVGMLIDPALILKNWTLILVLTGVVVIGKALGVSLGAFLSGTSVREAIQSGMSMGNIGEFSFIIAGVGATLGATKSSLYPVAVSVSALTTLLAPFLVRASTRVAPWIDERLPKPIQTFAGLYGSWIARFRSSPHAESFSAQLRRLIFALVIDAAVIAAIIIGTSVELPDATAFLGETFHLGIAASHAIIAAVAFVLSIPFVLGLVRCARSLGLLIATEAVARPSSEETTEITKLGPLPALVVVIQLGVVLVIGAPLVALTEPFLPSSSGAMLLGLLLALLGLAFWKSASDLEGKVRAGTQQVIDVLAKQTHNTTMNVVPEVEQAINQSLPWFEGMRSIRLAAGSPAVGKTLAEINLRGRTGATVIALMRGDKGAALPSAYEVLREDDVLAVVGSANAIKAAELVLAVKLAGASEPGRDPPEGDETVI